MSVASAELVALALDLGIDFAERLLADREDAATWLRVGRALAEFAGRLPREDFAALGQMRVVDILGGELASEVALRVQDEKARRAGLVT